MKRRESGRIEVRGKLKTPANRHTIKEKKLFEYLMRKYNLRDDAALADFLYTSPSVISQVRNDKIPFSHRLILTTYDKTKLSIEDIRKMVREDCDDER